MDFPREKKVRQTKSHLRRTVEKEIKAMGLTWGAVEMAALDRIGWRQRHHAPHGAKSKKKRRR